MIMAERPLKYALFLPFQPGNTISPSNIIELCRQQLVRDQVHLIENTLKRHRGCFRYVRVGVYFFSFQRQVQCSSVSDDDVSEVVRVQSDHMWDPVTEEVNEAAYAFFYKGEDAVKAAVLKDRIVDAPTDAADAAVKELKLIERRLELSSDDTGAEFVDENERTAALYFKLKPELDANGFYSSNLKTTFRFGYDKSCCYISGGADIVLFNLSGILVVDVCDKTLDDSTEECELKGVATSESKLKPQTTDINHVIGEGIIFTSRYLLRMIADGKAEPEDVATVKAYVLWMIYSSTIRFYSLKADFTTSTYSLLLKGTIHYTASQPRRLGQYLTLLLKKLKTP